MRLKNRVAVVTGAARGIGRATAIKFAKEGADVAILDILFDLAKETANEVKKTGRKAHAYEVDVGIYSQVQNVSEEIRKEFGTVDILVNNAGITRDKLLMKMTEQDWDEVIQTNLKGVFNSW